MTRVTRSEMPSSKVKLKSPLSLLDGYSLITHCLLVTNKHSQALVLKKSSVLHRMSLIDDAHSSQLMEWHNLGVTT